MKKQRYQFYEAIDSSCYLHYNSLDNKFLVLNEKHHLFYEQNDAQQIAQESSNLYKLLVDNRFLVENDFDEYSYVIAQKNKMLFDTSLYNVVVNTTLDCNLGCWYCYESRIPGSRLSDRVIDVIKMNIRLKYRNEPFKILKLSFFGGEPFLHFKGIKDLLDFGNTFCVENGLELIADFTTNATLITREHINYLKQYRCHFQITLDGNRETHNKIKVDRNNKYIDTYAKTLEVLRQIDENIPNRWLAVRINFDNRALRNITDIIEEIKFLDRKNTCIIVKKVWQLKTEAVDREALMKAIQTLLDNNFFVDYYIMPKGCVCFAERENQVLFNYDGKVFKCTTIPNFNDEYSLGEVNYDTGKVTWKEDKYKDWFKDMQPDYCKTCKWFPVCLGTCNRQLVAHKGEKLCTFDACSLTEKEYLMYLFKSSLLENEKYSKH